LIAGSGGDMNTEHPAFPHPTIQEAICEIHFQMPDSEQWNPSVAGEFLKRNQDVFPTMEPVTRIGFRFTAGPAGMEQALTPPTLLMRFRHANRPMLVQLSQGMLTVNVLPRYPGWRQMSSDVLDAWARATDVVRPAKLCRIGLRYINRIPRTGQAQQAGDWLKPSRYVAHAALSSLPGLLSRLEVQQDQESRLIVTLGELLNGEPLGLRSFLFDVDCITEKTVATDGTSLEAEIGRLHETAWTVFSASITPRLKRLLNGGDGK
jgi:uncharacterized protein (TIGR04255 family)